MPYKYRKSELAKRKDQFVSSEVGSKIIQLCLDVDETQEYLANTFHGPKVRAIQDELSSYRARLRAYMESNGYI